MSQTNYKTWRTVSKGTVVLRNGMTGFYLVINIGLPTQEKPKPYFFSRYISKKEEAVAEAMDLISSWEAAYKQAHTSCDQVIINNQNDGKEVNMKNQAQFGLRVLFSEEWISQSNKAEAILNSLSQTVLLKDERQYQPMALLFRDLLEAGKIPDNAQYIWVASPSGAKWEVRRVVKRESRNKIGPTGFDKPGSPIIVVTFAES